MSTLIGTGRKNSKIPSEESLSEYFQHYVKPADHLQIGLEAELLGVNAKTGKALPYEGANGVHEALKALVREFRYEALYDEKNIIGLKRGDVLISIEPGGQLELSAPPVTSAHAVEQQVQTFLQELRELQLIMPDVKWLAVGIQPYSTLDEISWVPKTRYKILADHLSKNGTLSHHMMKRTATNQFNMDYTSEEDAMEKLRIMTGITSIISAMFANSSFSEGKPNGYATYRLEIWNHTSPDRSGLRPEFARPGKRFKDYAEYLLDMPVIFIVRDEKWIAIKGKTFRQFLKSGYEGQPATWDDFELHLSSAFPEARIKQYLEIRGMDCQSPYLMPAAAAFWKGLLYDAAARQKAAAMVDSLPEEERVALHKRVPKEGLQAVIHGKKVLTLARELVTFAGEGLSKQKDTHLAKQELEYLKRIEEKILDEGMSPGEQFIRKIKNHSSIPPAEVVKEFQI